METRMRRLVAAIFGVVTIASAGAQPPARFSDGVKPYIRHATRRTILCHVRVIDGTGKAAADDRNVTIEDGKIAGIEAGADAAQAPETTVLDMRGRTVLPGLVMLHEHMYYIARP